MIQIYNSGIFVFMLLSFFISGLFVSYIAGAASQRVSIFLKLLKLHREKENLEKNKEYLIAISDIMRKV